MLAAFLTMEKSGQKVSVLSQPPLRSQHGHTHAGSLRAATLVLRVGLAAKSGSYSGVSVNKEIYGYGVLEPKTEKGKITFQAKSNAVTSSR